MKKKHLIWIALLTGILVMVSLSYAADTASQEGQYGNLHYRWNIEWDTAADGTNFTYDDDGRLLVHPETRSGMTAALRMTMIISSADTPETIPAGAVKFRIPASLFTRWNGTAADVLSTQMATTPEAASSTGISFIYSIEGDEIVVTNYKPLEAGTYFSADMAYIAEPLDVSGGYPDDSAPHENWWDNYLNENRKDFTATFSVQLGDTAETGELDFGLSAMTRVVGDAALDPMNDPSEGVYLAWQDVWGEKPADADDYFYVLWNVQYGRDHRGRLTQPSSEHVSFDPAENALSIGGQTFLPEMVGSLKTSDSVHGMTAYNHTTFSYYKHKGAPAGIAGNEAADARMVGSRYHPDYTWRYNYFVYETLTAVHYAELVRYPWSALDAAREAGINLAEDGLPVTGRFHVTETWDSGYEKDYPISADTRIFLLDAGTGGTYSKDGGYTIDGGQTILQNGSSVVGRKSSRHFTLSYNGYSQRLGGTLLGQHIVITDDTMWASSSKANKVNSWDPSDKEALAPEDYEYRGIWIYNSIWREYDGQQSHGIWTENAAPVADYDAIAPMKISILRRGGTDYEPYCAIYQTGAKAYTARTWDGTEAPGEAISLTDGFCPFPEGVAAFRVEHDSAFFRTQFTLSVFTRLLPSEHMKEIVTSHLDNEAKTYVVNEAPCAVSTLAEPDSVYAEYSGRRQTPPRLILTPMDAELKVDKTSFTPDDTDAAQKAAAEQSKEISYVMLRATQTVALGLSEAETTDFDDPYKLLSGRFYELLPPGTTVREGSITGLYDKYRTEYPYAVSDFAKQGGKFNGYGNYRKVIPNSNFTYYTYPDEATGQTMLVIDYAMEDPDLTQSDGMWFNSVMFGFVLENTFDNIQARGTLSPNAMGFVSDSPAEGMMVNKQNQYDNVDMGPRKPAFARIDADNRYAAFTQVNVEWNNVRVLEAGFSKTVRSSETKNGLTAELAYRDTAEAVVGNTYTYRLKFTNTPVARADSIILYDILENGTPDKTEIQWKGVLQDIDLSMIREMPTDGGTATCAPVVYYSTTLTARNDVTGTYFDLSDSAVWSTTPPGNLKDVKAIAIDCSRDTEGNPFILGKEQSLYAYLTMDTPKEYIEGKTINGSVAAARMFANDPPTTPVSPYDCPRFSSDAEVTLLPTEPGIVKASDPETGTKEDPCDVDPLGNGTIDYILTIRNDGTYDLRNVVVEDEIPDGLTITEIQASVNGFAALRPIEEAAGITCAQDGRKLSFTIVQQHPGDEKKTTIVIKTTVDALTASGQKRYENTAAITAANDISLEEPLVTETMYHIAELIDITVEKIWLGPTGDPVTAVLQADGTEKDTAVLNEGNQWKHTFEKLLKYDETDHHEILYKLDEVEQEGYKTEITGSAAAGFTVTNIELIDIPVEKKWIGPKADEVPITLLADGVAMETIVLDETNQWKHTFEKFPRYDPVDSHEIIYSPAEPNLENYLPQISGTMAAGFTITNVNTETIDITGQKTWEDNGRSHDNALEITLVLQRTTDKADAMAEEMTETPVWEGARYTFKKLPKYDAEGYEYIYTVSELPVEGYQPPEQDGNDFINRIIPTPVPAPSPAPTEPSKNTFHFFFTKEWIGGREENIDFSFYMADGTPYKHKFNRRRVDENTWLYECWLTRGRDYFVVETPIEGYQTRYENEGDHESDTDRCYNGGKIINYRVPKTEDQTPVELILVLMGISLVGIVLILFRKKK